ncbi:MAG: zf-TFIIB domain-containing protein [Myxococcales bacterium]|nr:zf-TFIIB domain-containing protein [Myxococcales bacterium]MBP6847994.1 zf-TFIIB domain-containing protein [Kofleriaceae bacterium]
MPFRDRPPSCPRCRHSLERGVEAEDRWHCGGCDGALLATSEVVDALLAVAPDLQPGGSVRDLSTMGRRGVALPCPQCDALMEPSYLGGVEVDRCRRDGLFWLDLGELDRVLAQAVAQRDARAEPLGRLRRWFGW